LVPKKKKNCKTLLSVFNPPGNILFVILGKSCGKFKQEASEPIYQ